MLEAEGFVVEVDNEFAWVETQRQSACGHCDAKSGCSTASLSQVLGQKRTVIKVTNQAQAQVGDRVIIGVKEQVMLRSAILMYLVPLLSLFTTAMGYEYWAQQGSLPQHELFTLFSAVFGFAMGLFWLNRIMQNKPPSRHAQPVVLRIAHAIHIVPTQ